MYTIIIQDMAFDKTIEVDVDIIPRIGDTLPLFHKPYPKVTDVILNIGVSDIFTALNKYKETNKKIHAIIYVC
jgi:hypothetical protein